MDNVINSAVSTSNRFNIHLHKFQTHQILQEVYKNAGTQNTIFTKWDIRKWINANTETISVSAKRSQMWNYK